MSSPIDFMVRAHLQKIERYVGEHRGTAAINTVSFAYGGIPVLDNDMLAWTLTQIVERIVTDADGNVYVVSRADCTTLPLQISYHLTLFSKKQ